MVIVKDNNVFYGKTKIAKVSNDGKILYTYKDYKRHLLRKLNSFGLNNEAYSNLEPEIIKIFINRQKYYLITKEKYNKFMVKFRTLVKFKGYERQLMIPLAIMDLYEEKCKTRKGLTIEEFIEKINDPHSLYGNWKGRLK